MHRGGVWQQEFRVKLQSAAPSATRRTQRTLKVPLCIKLTMTHHSVGHTFDCFNLSGESSN
eukprot:6227510-Amphidinium_carterae.1